ncbi:ABC transporter permease [Thermosphaera aggregans]|uniref:Binding-protein-dependent transport systems inner membrane component n=1 Tax=Thermosphaera aggregans (strain DSM 11486 / M11TL) TaxID=633148 RepID=D5U2N3_THEAM|nr:ABC transporter permease [Thermosphaera aggregans]ADG91383.1 binding-protein-dependent transport systems inner membrane component [Thermosphaera aggregans DSM 11486]
MRGFTRYLLLKTIFLLLTYFIALLITFLLPRMVPGNPVQQIIAGLSTGAISPEALSQYQRRLVEAFDLDKPWYIQFLNYISRSFRGDLGVSITSYGEPVVNLIARHLPWTLALIVPASITAWFVGNFLGGLAGYKRGSMLEKILISIGMVLSQIPYYWLAMSLIFLFAVTWKLLPPGSAYTPTLQPSLTWQFLLDYLQHYILPFLSILIPSIGGWLIGMRVLVSTELGSTYVYFSNTMGVKDGIVFKYVLRNSMLPQVTGLSIQLGFVMAGQIITEQIFNYQGMGILLARALGTRDYPLIQGIFLILIGTILLANYLVDFIYVIIDPRIRLGYKSA